MSKKIKVLFILPSLKKGGPVSGTIAIVKYIDRKCCDVVVSCLDKVSDRCMPVIRELERSNINIKPFDISGWPGLLRFKKVGRYVEKESFDIVHSYGIRPDIINFLVSKRNLSVSIVREMLHDLYHRRNGFLVSRTFGFMHLSVLKRMDNVITISRKIKDYLVEKEKMKPEKITVIKNCIDLSWMHNPEHQHSKNKTERQLSGERINIGVVAHLVRIKRVDWIISAVSDVLKKNRDLKVKLHLIGDGPLRSKLQKMVEKLRMAERVKFHGHVYDVASIVKEMDLTALASKTEGMPRALMEAMSLGKTCIGPNIGGVSELIEDNVTGYLFNPDSYEDLLKKLEHVLLNRAFLDPDTIKRHIEENHNAEKAAARTQALYIKLCNSRVGVNI